MKADLVSERNNVFKIHVKGGSVYLMNALRRSFLSEVPTVAIKEIKIYENSSPMFDEYIGLRLGLLPLRASGKEFSKGEKAKLTLEKEGPCIVYSKDILSSTEGVEILEKEIPIIKLDKGQKIKMEMIAERGYGKEHVKHQAGLFSYRQLSMEEVSKGKIKEDMKFSEGENFSDNEFLVCYENYGNITDEEFVKSAVEALKERGRKLEKALK